MKLHLGDSKAESLKMRSMGTPDATASTANSFVL